MLDLKDKFGNSEIKRSVTLVALMIIATLFLCLTINSVFYNNIQYPKLLYCIVNIFAACLIMSPLVFIRFKFKNEDILYLIAIIHMYLYLCVSAYICCDKIEWMQEHYKSLIMLILWFIPLFLLIHNSVKIFLKKQKLLIFILSIFITFLGFINESNWTVFDSIITCIMFLLKFENLQTLSKGIFDIKIEDSDSNKDKLTVVTFITVIFLAAIHLSLNLSEYLSELLIWICGCKYPNCNSRLLNNEIITKQMWLGFYKFIILVVILIIIFAIFNYKKDIIPSYIKNIFDCEDNAQDQKNQEIIDKVYASKHNLDNKNNDLAKAKKSFKGAYDGLVSALAEFNAREAAYVSAQEELANFKASGVNDSATLTKLQNAADRAQAHLTRATNAPTNAQVAYNNAHVAALEAKAVYEAALQAYKKIYNEAIAMGINPADLPPVVTAAPLYTSFPAVPGAKELYAETLRGKFSKSVQAAAKKGQKEAKKRAKPRRKPARMVLLLKLVQERKSSELPPSAKC